jgi:hypothetical protein
MKKTLRFSFLVAVLAAAPWLAQPHTGEAQQQSCSNLPRPCTVGTVIKCEPNVDGVRQCRCVAVAGRSAWLCSF